MRASICLTHALLLAACGPNTEPQAANTEVVVALPPAEPAKRSAPPPPMAPPPEVVTLAATPEPVEKEREDASPAAGERTQSSAAEPPPARPAEPAAAQAEARVALPLPAATVASTIRRIGYACPEVVGSEPLPSEASGSTRYRITCSSGDAYRGTVENGRMRFRRLDRDGG